MLKTERIKFKKAIDELSFVPEKSLHKCIKLFVSSKVEFRHNTRCQGSIKGKNDEKIDARSSTSCFSFNSMRNDYRH